MKEILVDFIRKYAPVSDEQAGVLADYALATWQPLPREIKYLHITGDHGTGKTILGRVMTAVCKNPLVAQGLSYSAMLDQLDSVHPTTLIIQEGDVHNLELRELLEFSFSENHSIIQMCQREDGSVFPRFYKVHGYKIIISRLPFSQPAIASRCIRVELRASQEKSIIDFTDFGNESAQIGVILEAVYGGEK